MLQSFYKYLIEDLVLNYFKKYPIERGSRYYLIIENNDYRDGLIETIKNIATPITISNIYEGGETQLLEEEYNTCYLQASLEQPKIIIGYDQNATEDYLTTMRNAIGIPGSAYADCALLYILSDSGLSSLITASKDLQGENAPLSSKVIIGNITDQAEEKIHREVERAYLKKYLEKIASYIADGSCNLFDFKHALAILHKGELKGCFADLDFFNDNVIYEGSFDPSEKDLSQRITENQNLFDKINNIMISAEDNDKVKLLEDVVGEKLANTIFKTPNWKDEIQFQTVLDENDKTKAPKKLELVDIELPGKSLMTSMVWHSIGKPKKTDNHIIICDPSEAESQPLKLQFNNPIANSVSNKECFVRGSTITIDVADTFIRQTVGSDSNRHKFFIRKVHIPRSFFKNVESIITFSSKGDFILNLLDGCETLVLGDGNIKTILPLSGVVKWEDDFKLEIPIDEYEDVEKFSFQIVFNESIYNFTVKLSASKPLLPVGPEYIQGPIWDNCRTYHGIQGEGTHYMKIYCSEEERITIRSWRWYLDMEQKFIQENTYLLQYDYNHLTHEEKYLPSFLNLPEAVKDSLDKLYTYFKDNDTIPSLSYMNEELEALYINYWRSVKQCIEQIPTNRALTEKEYSLTKLGVVEKEDRIYFSPFHPIMVAYMLEFKSNYDNKEKQPYILNLLTPFYLIPYITYDDQPNRPYSNSELDKNRTWLCYENTSCKPQERTNNITKKMVTTKTQQFIKHFNYLFQEKDCPVILSSIGFDDDKNIIIGIIEFIKNEYKNGEVQKIELHEYVSNLMNESFYEKLNRLNTVDAIVRELNKYGVSIEEKDIYTSQEIVHQLFTKIAFYKHLVEDNNPNIGYCHIAFYQMDAGNEYITPSTDEMRLELSMNGLISIPSTSMNKKGNAYYIGFGTKGLKKDANGFIYPMATCMNNLYANEKNNGANQYHDNTAVVKKFAFHSTSLLESIYENANWVTFLNPEVDINFFFQQELYIVHYTDQYTINAKYDSITVTKHVDQYENMIRQPYRQYSLSDESFNVFNKTMINYFNCLNGSWMLNIVNKTEVQIREKMSVVAACIAMLPFMRRTKDIIWIPVSLEEILRVTGSIGLSKEYIFTKKMLNVKGEMSDDLLMIGLNTTNPKDIKFYMYPVEVKMSKNTNSLTDKGMKQVCQTYTQIHEHIFGESNFTKSIYRTFFASQFLANAEKLHANGLISEDTYQEIESFRYELLNLDFTLEELLPVIEMGHAALVCFDSNANSSMETVMEDNIAVCQIHLKEKDAFDFVARPDSRHLAFLETDQIMIEDSIRKCLSNWQLRRSSETRYNTENGVALVAMEDIENDILHTKSKPYKVVTNGEDEAIKTVADSDDQGTLYQLPNIYEGIKIKVGKVLGTQRELFFEPNNSQKISHPNLAIIGTMGTGKTQFARSVIAQFSKETSRNLGGHPIGILIFDYKGDYKDREFLDLVGGHAYKFNFPFNPLKLVINENVEGINLPAITADKISDSFAKAYGLGLKQQNRIKQVIIETYLDKGITIDPSTWGKIAPTMHDVIQKYFEKYDADDKAYALFDKMNDYSIFTQDNSQCVSLFEWLNCVQVIDLTMYPDDTKKVIVSLILDLFYAEMRQLGESKKENGFRELRSMIMVDEAHHFLKKDFTSLRSIISEGRMFGVGMILSTQNVGDFKTSEEDYTQFILSWVIHHVNNISRSEIASIFGATDPNSDKYMNFISKAKLFESVCKLGGYVEGIRDLPFFELIEDDKRFH